MKNVDVYKQYFGAECTFNGVQRQAAVVWLNAESDSQRCPKTESGGRGISAVMLQFHPDYPEPCAAAYDKSAYPFMKAACDQGIRSIVKALGSGHIETVTADELKRSGSAFAELDPVHAFHNINTPDDYRSLSN